MRDILNKEEIFDVAINIEKNGEKFYSQIAQNTKNEKLKKIFNFLAEQEKEHEKLFTKMKEKFVGKKEFHTLYDYWEDQEKQEYLSYVAKSEIFPFMENKTILESLEDAKRILAYAIIIEKETILFYREILDAIHEKTPELMEEKAALISLIEEERKHIVQLSELLQNVKEGKIEL